MFLHLPCRGLQWRSGWLMLALARTPWIRVRIMKLITFISALALAVALSGPAAHRAQAEDRAPAEAEVVPTMLMTRAAQDLLNLLGYDTGPADGLLGSRTRSAVLAFQSDRAEPLTGIIDRDLLDSLVLRVPKAYPGYYGSYGEFDTIRQFTDGVPNLFLAGRNGMHRYNNQDHSMLTARFAADAIIAETADKSALWAVNIDDDYHEERAA